jgi:hypothetical protein
LLLGGHLFSDQVFAYLYIAWIPVLAGEVRFGIGIVEAVRVCSQWRHVVATSPVLKILPVFVAVCCLWLFALVELGAAHTMVLHASRRMED